MTDITIQKQGRIYISESEYNALRLTGKLQPNTEYCITKVTNKGGTEVVANPTGSATAELSKLQVGDSVYSIPSSSGSSGSGVQVQADWNVNDESNPSFIKNKPFGYDSVVAVFRKDSLDEYQGRVSDDDGRWFPVISFNPGQNELTLVDGETYHVKCSSDQGAVEYTGKARNMGGTFVLGDYILEDGSPNHNFNVGIIVGETHDESLPLGIGIAFNDLKADAEDAVPTLTNVSITIEKVEIKKIPSWFLELPDIHKPNVPTVYMIYKSKYDNGDYNANGSITGKPIYEAVNNGSTIYYVDDSSPGPHFANRYYTMTSIWIADSCGDGNFNIDCTYTSWEYDTSGAYVCRENTLNMGFTNA